LYFFENKKEKAKEHLIDLKKSIMYYIKIIFKTIKNTFTRSVTFVRNLSPSEA